jgi:hypothetical protein
LNAIDDDLEQRSIPEGRRVDIVDRDGPVRRSADARTLFAEVRQRASDGVVAS